MEFMTGYYRRKEDFTAVLLQQYVCRSVPVCLGCICGGDSREAGIAGGSFTGRILEEFRKSSLPGAVKRRPEYLKKIGRQLCKCRESCAVSSDFWTAGILCIGEEFLLFCEGAVKIALCNMGFGRPAMYEIGGDDQAGGKGLQLQRGSMETGIGVLLASESFYRNIPREDMRNCLWVKEINDSGQVQKRLQELGKMAERRGGRQMGALLLEVRQGEGNCSEGGPVGV